MGVVLLIMGLAWLFGSAEDASKKKMSNKRRYTGRSSSAQSYYRETGMWPWWD